MKHRQSGRRENKSKGHKQCAYRLRKLANTWVYAIIAANTAISKLVASIDCGPNGGVKNAFIPKNKKMRTRFIHAHPNEIRSKAYNFSLDKLFNIRLFAIRMGIVSHRKEVLSCDVILIRLSKLLHYLPALKIGNGNSKPNALSMILWRISTVSS